MNQNGRPWRDAKRASQQFFVSGAGFIRRGSRAEMQKGKKTTTKTATARMEKTQTCDVKTGKSGAASSQAQKAHQPHNEGAHSFASREPGLSVMWFTAGDSAPAGAMRVPSQMPKHNAKSNRLYLEAEPLVPDAQTSGSALAVRRESFGGSLTPQRGVKPPSSLEFCPPTAGDLHVMLRGKPVHKISYTLPAPPASLDNESGAGRGADTWVQLNEPKSEYVVQLKLVSDAARPAWMLVRMLVYVPNAVALELWPGKDGREANPIGWRPGEPVTISAVFGI